MQILYKPELGSKVAVLSPLSSISKVWKSWEMARPNDRGPGPGAVTSPLKTNHFHLLLGIPAAINLLLPHMRLLLHHH